MKDIDTINALIEHLKKRGYPDLKISERPDLNERQEPAIDAIAYPFAIEHTSIDVLPNQRERSDWFGKVVNDPEQELSKQIPFRLSITIPYEGINKGQPWEEIRIALKNWIINEAPQLEDGMRNISNIPSIPFLLSVSKESDRPSGVFFSRFIPDDNMFHVRIKEQFDRKIEKLKKYENAHKTLLLIENSSFGRVSVATLQNELRKAYPEGVSVNQIWFADTSIPNYIEFYKIEHSMME